MDFTVGVEKASKWQKRPIVIEAIQWKGTPESWEEVRMFCPTAMKNPAYNSVTIPTLKGSMIARATDWIIKGVHGEFYPCKADIFAETYDYYYDEEDN